MFQPGSLLAPPAEFHLERLRRRALEAPNPHAEGSRLWILLEESKAEHTPLSEDRPYVPLSVYQSSDIVANSTGRALLARAVETNRRDVVRFLLSRGLDVNDEYMKLLHSSVWAGQWFATVLLLDCGADVDVRATDRRRTPLMRAADRTRSVRAEVMPAHLAMVRLLLSRGADFRAKDRMGHQAHQIAAMGTPVRTLLSDVRAAGAGGPTSTAIACACSCSARSARKGARRRATGSSRGSSQRKRSRLRDHQARRTTTPSSSTGPCLQATYQ